MDLVVTSLNAARRILLNSGDTGSHWLMLKLTGPRSHRDAIGATVKLTTPFSVGFCPPAISVYTSGWDRSATSVPQRKIPADQLLQIDEQNDLSRLTTTVGRGEP